MVNYSENNHLDRVFFALSDPTRRAIIERLTQEEMTVKNLAEPFEMSLPAISKHLRVLETAGIVSQRKEGRFRYYHLNPCSMQSATEWINHWSRFWTASFSNLERFLEQEEDKDT
jgi:DNA-binding transcriptional ArsR family regulator